MLTIEATQEWRLAYPGAHIGLLEISGVDNSRTCAALDAEKCRVEQQLCQHYGGFTRSDFLALPIMKAYERYYKKFDKTYHVLLQVESVALKGKSLPEVSMLVDANFTAELETMVLTAGHDVARLQPPVWMDLSREGDFMVRMNGAPKQLRAGDMAMRDASGVVCTVIYGQDHISLITRQTSHVLYVSYAPAGVEAEQVAQHLENVEANVRRCASSCRVEQRRIISA
ncbi:MAG: hypothetical protein JW726_13670 [Anaerolineales bacterium]|nr:hypothetical protein [Anaerolineales bacterium]